MPKKLIAIILLFLLILPSCMSGTDIYASEMLNRPQSPENIANLPDGYQEKFADAYAVNQDIRGAVFIKETLLNYPVVQNPDNIFYLTRDFYKNKSDKGVPFLDKSCIIAKDRISANLIIYAHNLRSGQFFGQLAKYKDLDFYKEHPIINFDTVYEDMEWVIFGVMLTNADPEDGPVFRYHDFIEPQDSAHYEWFANQVKLRSIIDTGIGVQPGENLLSLSTVDYDMGVSASGRLVIVARQLRPGETIDISAAVLNESPLYPDLWYSKNNREKPTEYNDVSTDYHGSADPFAFPEN